MEKIVKLIKELGELYAQTPNLKYRFVAYYKDQNQKLVLVYALKRLDSNFAIDRNNNAVYYKKLLLGQLLCIDNKALVMPLTTHNSFVLFPYPLYNELCEIITRNLSSPHKIIGHEGNTITFS